MVHFSSGSIRSSSQDCSHPDAVTTFIPAICFAGVQLLAFEYGLLQASWACPAPLTLVNPHLEVLCGPIGLEMGYIAACPCCDPLLVMSAESCESPLYAPQGGYVPYQSQGFDNAAIYMLYRLLALLSPITRLEGNMANTTEVVPETSKTAVIEVCTLSQTSLRIGF